MGPVDGDCQEQTLGPGAMAKPLDRTLTEGRPGHQLWKLKRNRSDVQRAQSPRKGVPPN